jgi:GNAT superfamily N-acetyltransferase
MGDLKYVEAGPQDIERVGAFLGFPDLKCLEHEYWTYLSDLSVLFIALDGERVIGTQAFVPHEVYVNGRLTLTGRSERTMVSPDYRGQDVFANLIDHCVQRGTEKGHQFFWGASTAATKAFRRAGFLHMTGHREYLIAAASPQRVASYLMSPGRSFSLRPKDVLKTVRTRDRKNALEYAKIALTPLSLAARVPLLARAALTRDTGIELTTSVKNEGDIDALYARLRRRAPFVHLKHSSAFHRWLLDDGNHNARWFFAYRADDLAAYACLNLTDPSTGTLVDFAAIDNTAFRLVLEAARHEVSDAGRAFVTAICNPHNAAQRALYPAFYAGGFIPSFRGGNSVIRPGAFKDMSVLAEAASFYMTDFWGILYRSKDA